MSVPARPRWHLRQLPLSARLVLTVFLVFVGAGYFSALVQLHIAHSDQKGSPLPTPNDVVKRFSTFEEYDKDKSQKSHIEELISGHRSEGWGASNMTPAFFDKSSGYEPYRTLRPSDPKRKAVDEAREGERRAMIAFIKMDTKERRAAYEANAMSVPKDLKSHPITADFVIHGNVGQRPVSAIERLISGKREGDLDKNNMTPAFFEKSSKYEQQVKKRSKEAVDAEREAERQALVTFTQLPPNQQKKAYDADEMDLPPALKGKPLNEEYFDKDKLKVKVQTLIGDRCGRCHDVDQEPNFPNFNTLAPLIAPEPPRETVIKIKTLIDNRCGRCHNENQAPQFPTYDKLEPFITPATPETRSALGKEWVGSKSTMSTSKLVESTHAHALSFAVLFCLTGLIYAHTSQPAFLRGMLAPIVLIAQMADLSCWWLARLDLPWGPLFALAIMGTGGVVGLGLSLQIVLSLFDMYRWKGRAVLAIFLGIGLAILGMVYGMWIHPSLQAQKERAAGEQQQQEPEKKPDDPAKQNPPGGRTFPQ